MQKNQTHADSNRPLPRTARGSARCLAYGDEVCLSDEVANKTRHRVRTETPGWSRLAKIHHAEATSLNGLQKEKKTVGK